MAPRHYFNEKGEVLPLVELMKLEKLDDWTFRSCSKAYAPTGGANGAYGGFVYSLAAWAAARTVAEGLILHVCGYHSYISLDMPISIMVILFMFCRDCVFILEPSD